MFSTTHTTLAVRCALACCLFPSGLNQGGRYRAVAHLPTSIIGWVIGHKGCNARMLKQQTGTELWVDVPGQVRWDRYFAQKKLRFQVLGILHNHGTFIIQARGSNVSRT